MRIIGPALNKDVKACRPEHLFGVDHRLAYPLLAAMVEFNSRGHPYLVVVPLNDLRELAIEFDLSDHPIWPQRGHIYCKSKQMLGVQRASCTSLAKIDLTIGIPQAFRNNNPERMNPTVEFHHCRQERIRKAMIDAEKMFWATCFHIPICCGTDDTHSSPPRREIDNVTGDVEGGNTLIVAQSSSGSCADEQAVNVSSTSILTAQIFRLFTRRHVWG